MRLATLAVLLVASTASAEDAGEVIVITGQRMPSDRASTPASVTVIDRDALDRSPSALTDDVVRDAPSVATFRRSSSLTADPTSQGLALRGVGPSGVSRALVLLDGVPQNDPFGGWVYWRALPLLSISRIEIVPGAGSALFGDFALGGVLQMVSRPIEGDQLEAIVTGGSLETARGAARLTTRIAGVGVELTGEAFHAGGYAPIAPAQRGAIDHDASSDHASAGARLERAFGDVELTAFGRWFDESLDAGTAHTTADVRNIEYGASAKLAGRAGTLAVSGFGSDQRFRQERARITGDRAGATTASHQRTPSNSQGASISLTSRALRAGATSHVMLAGIDALRVTGTATDMLVPATPSSDALAIRDAGGSQRFAGVFVQDAVQLGALVELDAALRLDGYQIRDGHQTLTTVGGTQTPMAFADRAERQLDPRLAALVHATRELALRASVARGFRAPTLNELYRPFQVGTVLTAANPALRPETSWGGELGPELTLPQGSARATAFWTRLDDPIDNVTLDAALPSGATRQRQNLGAARIRGVELELRTPAWRRWSAAAGYTYANATVTDAPAQPLLIGKRLAQDPRHRATFSATFDDPRIAALTAQASYTSRQFEDDQNALSMGWFVVVDAMAARRIGAGLSLFASITNLFDARYVTGRAGIDTLGPPRAVELGVKLVR